MVISSINILNKNDQVEENDNNIIVENDDIGNKEETEESVPVFGDDLDVPAYLRNRNAD